jgi:DNA excision repair protein ERCC-4
VVSWHRFATTRTRCVRKGLFVRILADVHERASGVPRLLVQAGVSVEIKSLRSGDYTVGDGAIVERKTVRGMHAAIIAGTFWPQIGKLRQFARIPYLLIEGCDLDDGPLTPEAIRGASLAVADLGIAIVRSSDTRDSALWLYRLADRRQRRHSRNRPAYAQRPKREIGVPAAEAALGCVPGISVVLARALLRRFGTLAAVVAANPSEWQTIPGIGPHKAKALAATFRTPQTASHSPRRAADC